MNPLFLYFCAITALATPPEKEAPPHIEIPMEPPSETITTKPRHRFTPNVRREKSSRSETTTYTTTTSPALITTTSLVSEDSGITTVDPEDFLILPSEDLDVMEQIVDKDGNLVGENPNSENTDSSATPEDNGDDEPGSDTSTDMIETLPTRVIANGIEYNDDTLAQEVDACFENVITTTDSGAAIVYDFRIVDFKMNSDDTFDLEIALSNDDGTALIRQGTYLFVNKVNSDQTHGIIFYTLLGGEASNQMWITNIPTSGEKTMLLNVSAASSMPESTTTVSVSAESEPEIAADALLVDEINSETPVAEVEDAVDVITDAVEVGFIVAEVEDAVDVITDAVEVDIIAAEDVSPSIIQDVLLDEEITEAILPTR